MDGRTGGEGGGGAAEKRLLPLARAKATAEIPPSPPLCCDQVSPPSPPVPKKAIAKARGGEGGAEKRQGFPFSLFLFLLLSPSLHSEFLLLSSLRFDSGSLGERFTNVGDTYIAHLL